MKCFIEYNDAISGGKGGAPDVEGTEKSLCEAAHTHIYTRGSIGIDRNCSVGIFFSGGGRWNRLKIW